MYLYVRNRARRMCFLEYCLIIIYYDFAILLQRFFEKYPSKAKNKSSNNNIDLSNLHYHRYKPFRL